MAIFQIVIIFYQLTKLLQQFAPPKSNFQTNPFNVDSMICRNIIWNSRRIAIWHDFIKSCFPPQVVVLAPCLVGLQKFPKFHPYNWLISTINGISLGGNNTFSKEYNHSKPKNHREEKSWLEIYKDDNCKIICPNNILNFLWKKYLHNVLRLEN